MKHEPSCIFCQIISKKAEASIIYEDDLCMAFMGIQPAQPGECMVIPKEHIDHFTDIPDSLAAHIVLKAQRIGRKMMGVLDPPPRRIGYVVHGFGVPHAHFIIVPQHQEDDIISGRHLEIQDGKIVANMDIVRSPPRQELDDIARLLKID